MCETHHETKRQRENNNRESGSPPEGVRRKARETIRQHGRGPREGDQWFLVKRGQERHNRRVQRRERPSQMIQNKLINFINLKISTIL